MKYMLKLFFLSISFINFFLEAQVIHITSLNQLKSIISNNKNVIIKFYADFCPPCKGFAPIYAQISEESLFNSIIFVEVNTQQNKDITSFFRVQSIPTIIFIQDQKTIGIETGSKGAGQFKTIINRYFSL